MQKIHQLPLSIVAKIAAGEVIERPAYVVKELIDNAIDAGADMIEIRIENGGVKRIVVHDNGEGMSQEDIRESYKLHTTSKISQENELQHISSLGFRGEALASIAAVSELVIQSRTHTEKVGTKIFVISGKLIQEESVGMPVGTSVIVSHLFQYTPGRKKFLRSAQREGKHIIDTVMYQAVSHPHISFSLFHNGRSILEVKKTTDVANRLHLLVNKKIRDQLLPITIEEQYFTLHGFIAPPTTVSVLKKQVIFINKRHVYDTFITQSLKESIGSLLPAKRHPIFILFFQLPHELVDVNVHPRKEQVNLLIQDAIDTAFKKHVPSLFSAHSRQNWLFEKQRNSTQSFTGMILRETVSPFLHSATEKKIHEDYLQVHNTFILLTDERGFTLYDQHAVHERILYEQFSEAFKEQVQMRNITKFTPSYLLDFSITDRERVRDSRDQLEKIGIEVVIKKEKVFLQSIPKIFSDRNYEEIILEIVNRKGQRTIDSLTKTIVTYLACRTAIKAGDALDKDEIKKLLIKLKETKNNLTCPHGRPTSIHVSLEELYNVFQRT